MTRLIREKQCHKLLDLNKCEMVRGIWSSYFPLNSFELSIISCVRIVAIWTRGCTTAIARRLRIAQNNITWRFPESHKYCNNCTEQTLKWAEKAAEEGLEFIYFHLSPEEEANLPEPRKSSCLPSQTRSNYCSKFNLWESLKMFETYGDRE